MSLVLTSYISTDSSESSDTKLTRTPLPADTAVHRLTEVSKLGAEPCLSLEKDTVEIPSEEPKIFPRMQILSIQLEVV